MKIKGIKLSVWQIGLFKLCMVSAGVLIGIIFYDQLNNHTIINLLWALFLIPALYLLNIWLKQK